MIDLSQGYQEDAIELRGELEEKQKRIDELIAEVKLKLANKDKRIAELEAEIADLVGAEKTFIKALEDKEQSLATSNAQIELTCGALDEIYEVFPCLRKDTSPKAIADVLVKVRETIRWMAQTVHNAHHESGTFEQCRKNTCDAATQEIALLDGMVGK